MKGTDFFAQLAAQPPFAAVPPSLAACFKEYLSREKVEPWRGQQVINTHFPFYPSRAFEGMLKHFTSATPPRLYSVTLAVTNRCGFRCWHCYNAGRSQNDLPARRLSALAGELQDLGAVMVTLTGGEPLLRGDLEELCGAFDDRSCLILGTTGWGLTPARARGLQEAGVAAAGVSLDSCDEAEHDAKRGRPGAFRAALAALDATRSAGIYPYVVAVATREFLERPRFMRFLRFIRSAGAMEAHLLEPSATGRLAGRREVLLTADDRRRLLEYQAEAAAREDLPILSTYAHLESPDAFGCGAGITHLYIDGSGEVCPCNLVPLSFGNVGSEPLETILARMACSFQRPRCECAGRTLARHVPAGPLPLRPKESQALCRRRLPRRHALPRFFRLRSESPKRAGARQLRQAYDHVHRNYDDFWTVAAGRPVRRLVARLQLTGGERIFEAGCGSGVGTQELAAGLTGEGRLLAVDLSRGMLREARKRLPRAGHDAVTFRCADALRTLVREHGLDLVFTSWVLGYIPLRPFFEAAERALRPGGRLAFIVHRDRSPQTQLDLFGRLVARDPSVLTRTVQFDFPRDKDDTAERLEQAGLRPLDLWEGRVRFNYPTAQGVLEHLLKSGAGTVFYEALDPARRTQMEQDFVALQRRQRGAEGHVVEHRYVACIAEKR